jgi:RNA polymerase sigma-B factor
LAAKGMEWGIPGVSDRRFKRIEDFSPCKKLSPSFPIGKKRALPAFYEDFSQQETARQLGISQMHVSRLENRSLGKIRQFMGTETREKVYS